MISLENTQLCYCHLKKLTICFEEKSHKIIVLAGYLKSTLDMSQKR